MKARIQPTAARYPKWRAIFGTDEVPILEPPRENADGCMRMLVDVTQLDAGQRQRLAVQASKQWRIPCDRVLEEMVKSGSITVSGEDVEVVEEVVRLF